MVKNTAPRASAASRRGRVQPRLSSSSASVPSPPATRANARTKTSAVSTARNNSNKATPTNSKDNPEKADTEANSQTDQPPLTSSDNNVSSLDKLKDRFASSQKEYESTLKKATERDTLISRATFVVLMEKQIAISNELIRFGEHLMEQPKQSSDTLSEKLHSDFKNFAAQLTTTVNKLSVKMTSSLEKMGFRVDQPAQVKPSEANVIAGNFAPPLVKLPLDNARPHQPKPKPSFIEVSAEAEGVDGVTVRKTFSDALKSTKLDTAIDKIIPKEGKILVLTRNAAEANKIMEGLKDEKRLNFRPILAFKPTIRLENVDFEFIDEEIPSEKFNKNEVFDKNPQINKDDFLKSFHVVKVYQTKSNIACGTKTVLISTTPNLRSIACAISRLKIGIMNCRVADHISPTRCGRCNFYGHTQKVCLRNPSCRRCLGDHETLECKTDPQPENPGCVACKVAGRKDFCHRIDDRTCPTRILAVRDRERRTDYGS